jgi:hypothetical protein
MTHPIQPPIVIEQSLVLGGRFNGSAPSAPPTSQDQGVWIYPSEAGLNGGRFRGGPPYEAGTPPVKRDMELGEPAQFVVIERAIVNMNLLGGGATWSIEIVNAAGRRALWINGGSSTTIYSGNDTLLMLAPDEWLELTTSGVAGGVVWCRIWTRRAGVYPSI